MIVYYLSFVSRTKTDDPEREKLKAKAKDIQREEADRIRLVRLMARSLD